ncbi:hypothetical protein [Frankia sp. R43]|uniref:hypothetical protein n=1 Tax=Frankia sp. R43 TaxID=269536 RepID=UPI00128F39BC|nr:hypothetical protein [Frankia sp. R43]
MAVDPPQPDPPQPEVSKEHRILVSQFMVTALLGTALQEAVDPVSTAIRSQGVTLASYTLFAIFFLTIFRFFVGDILHLQSDDLVSQNSGFRWLLDLFIITLECVVLIFMARVASLEESQAARFGFFDLLLLLYIIDIGWLSLVLLIDRAARLSPVAQFRSLLARQFIPYRWGILNAALGFYIILSGALDEKHSFSSPELAALLVVNIGAFILDLVIFNHNSIF